MKNTRASFMAVRVTAASGVHAAMPRHCAVRLFSSLAGSGKNFRLARQIGSSLFSNTSSLSSSTQPRTCHQTLAGTHLHAQLRNATRTLTSDATSKADFILESWAADIPHPDKKDKGGEDAYFILTRSPADGSSSIGVADGVGGWAEVGVDAGVYSKQLMMYTKMRLESDISPPCPLDALSVAYRMVREQGSCTACIAVLHGRKLQTLNLGDSGFVLLRPREEDGQLRYRVMFESKEQTHGFNFPKQLGAGSQDYPHHGDREEFEVQPGDVVVMATDGVWDNVFLPDIVDLMQECLDGSEVEKAAKRLAEKANKLGMSQVQSPFAERAWLEQRLEFSGGKLDDVTVVVARVAETPSKSDIPLL